MDSNRVTTADTRTTVAGGILLIAAGSALWGTDALFRRGLALDLPATTLVFLEHLVLVALTAPFLWRARSQLRNLRGPDWAAAIVIGAGASAIATVMFTSAFRYGDPTTPLLLQKVQPLVAVAAASLILKERLLPRFGWFLGAGLAGAYLVAFPSPTEVGVGALTPALLALGAAVLWGLGTVLGRHLTTKLTFGTVTALRFAIGLPTLAIALLWGTEDNGMSTIGGKDVLAIVLLALIPGLLALLLYYRGLSSAPASAATLAELAFPLSAVGLNYLVFDTSLTGTQWLGMLILVVTITTMTLLSQRGRAAIGVEVPVDPSRVS